MLANEERAEQQGNRGSRRDAALSWTPPPSPQTATDAHLKHARTTGLMPKSMPRISGMRYSKHKSRRLHIEYVVDKFSMSSQHETAKSAVPCLHPSSLNTAVFIRSLLRITHARSHTTNVPDVTSVSSRAPPRVTDDQDIRQRFRHSPIECVATNNTAVASSEHDTTTTIHSCAHTTRNEYRQADDRQKE